MTDLITADSSVGRVVIEFGVNRWVMVTVRKDDDQAQIGSRRELEAYLRQCGLQAGEARDLARKAWAERPADAEDHVASADDGLIEATGLGTGKVLLFVAAFVVILALIEWYVFAQPPPH